MVGSGSDDAPAVVEVVEIMDGGLARTEHVAKPRPCPQHRLQRPPRRAENHWRPAPTRKSQDAVFARAAYSAIDSNHNDQPAATCVAQSNAL